MSTKNETADKITTTLASAEKTFADFETKFSALGREVRDVREQVAAAQEERKRLADQWDYEEERRRRAILDQQKIEDEAREKRHAEREASVAAKEKMFAEVVAELFGLAASNFDPRSAKAALEKKLDAAEAKGRAIAEAAAKKEYETQKKIADAEAQTKLVRLEDENARLTKDNASLNAANANLAKQNNDLAVRMGDLSRDAFQAAGGLTSKANGALETAAQGAGQFRQR